MAKDMKLSELADRDCMMLDALDFQVGAVARVTGHWASEWPEFVRIAGIDKSRGKLNITITELDGNSPTDGFGIDDLLPQPRRRLTALRDSTDRDAVLEEVAIMFDVQAEKHRAAASECESDGHRNGPVWRQYQSFATGAAGRVRALKSSPTNPGGSHD